MKGKICRNDRSRVNTCSPELASQDVSSVRISTEQQLAYGIAELNLEIISADSAHVSCSAANSSDSARYEFDDESLCCGSGMGRGLPGRIDSWQVQPVHSDIGDRYDRSSLRSLIYLYANSVTRGPVRCNYSRSTDELRTLMCSSRGPVDLSDNRGREHHPAARQVVCYSDP